MPISDNQNRPEQPGTYMVRDRSNEKELIRLNAQDQLMTRSMGGVLSEQPDPTALRRVLDIGCGPGGWLIETAQVYPTMSLVGIDISQRMLDYAREQATIHQVQDRVEFHVMDALLMLEFPASFFDLVNIRLGTSFLRTWDWPKLLSEMLRTSRPGGVVRVTDSTVAFQNNSPALTQLSEMLMQAFYQAGHLFEPAPAGVIDHLQRLLIQHGCQHVQLKTHSITYQAGTPEGVTFAEDMERLFSTIRPFIEKRGQAPKDYDTIYQRALVEMQRPDFRAEGMFLTAWGKK